jgi:hypothetical protein
MMQTDHILALLVAERNRLDTAIQALQGSARPAARPAAKRRAAAPAAPKAVSAPKPKRTLSAAGRKAIIDAAKRRWDAIRAGKAPSPFAKAKGKQKPKA